MVRSDDPDLSPDAAAVATAAVSTGGGEIWGTWEELLLACAVSRHGTESWDVVATEVKRRSPFGTRLTPHGCRLRFRLIHRRFAGDGAAAAAAENGDGSEVDDEPAAAIAAATVWMEELRKVRVAELRREVERYDLSIGSLQSKVKRLKEERERSLSGETQPEVKDEDGAEEEEEDGKRSPEELTGDRVSGDDSGRSCKESNSTDLKRPDHGGENAAGGGDPAGSSEAAKEAAGGESKEAGGESGESVAESKEVEADKESSDVQSSASLSRRQRRRAKAAGEEAEGEEVSVPLSAAESQPLLAFLEMIRSNKSNSLFERRLESQESGMYGSTIRRHVDLEMVRAKLERTNGSGAYYSTASEFYRDLLLLCTNALVFFPASSPEHAAAAQLRTIVTKQISTALHKHHQQALSEDAAAPKAPAPALKPKSDADIAGSLLEKAPPLIVCRKRSSLVKSSSAAVVKDEKVEKTEPEAKEKEHSEEKQKKVVTRDKATAAASATTRGLRTNKSRGGFVKNSGSNVASTEKPTKASEGAATEGTKKSDKKSGGSGGSGAAAGALAKKRNAVDFLNRMKENSSSSTARVSLLETLKRSAVPEQKKAGKGDNRKEHGSGSRKSHEPAPAKRSVGRPPKRAAAPPTPPPAKRAKEEAPGKPSSSSKKRGRR